MIDPKLNTLPIDEEGDFADFEGKTLTAAQAAERTRKARPGLSINDTIAGYASMSVGARGADTSGVEAGSGAGAGTTYLGPGGTVSDSPAPTIVQGARGVGSTMRGEPSYNQERVNNVPTADEISTLAYDYWCAKGCPSGSHEDDWSQAEEELYTRRGLVRTRTASV